MDYEVIPPLPMSGPNDVPCVEAPEALPDPLDTIKEDQLFTSVPNQSSLEYSR